MIFHIKSQINTKLSFLEPIVQHRSAKTRECV